MERQIGEEFEIFGDTYRVVENKAKNWNCINCAFRNTDCWSFIETGCCTGREDKKKVYFEQIKR